jgi:BirA family biotin operon repressor/biotin-[acetyl-CoA-carboxylase] ligase
MMRATPDLRPVGTVPSTQATARELLAGGAASGTVVVADAQTGGRGRQVAGESRAWHSPPGGVYLTVIFRPTRRSLALEATTLVAAAAVARAVSTALGARGEALELKWPNDLLVRGEAGDRKLGGILCELVKGPDGEPAILVGVGVNVTLGDDDLPPDLAATATSVELEGGRDPEPARLAESIAEEVCAALARFEASGVPDLEAYRRWFRMTGDRVEADGPDGRLEGVVVGLSDEGALQVLWAGAAEPAEVRSGEIRRLRRAEASGP